MQFPKSSIFAFNACIDHIRSVNSEDLAKIEEFSPTLHQQASESFSWGMQKEVVIDIRACEFFLSKMNFDKKIIGGQAGNAAEQAAPLGVDSYLHSNFANPEMVPLFACPDKIFLANEKGFVTASQFTSQTKSAHHFVLENPENHTRFIASYDPLPMHLEDNFCYNITEKLRLVQHAFVGGFHMLKTPDRVRKFIGEISRWKKANPGIRIFAELGEFQSPQVMDTVRQELFPLVDMVGLNDTELSAFGCGLDELADGTKAILFHTQDTQKVFPEEKLDQPALEFAQKCASFKAEFGKCGSAQELQDYGAKFSESPAQTVGLGDTFSCAYFLAMK